MSDVGLTLLAAAKLVGGELIRGDAAVVISAVQSLAQATAVDASFLANKKYKGELAHTQAAVVLLSYHTVIPENTSFAVIRLRNPYVGFALLQCHFHPQPLSTGKCHASAIVDASAMIADDVQIDAQVSIAAGVRVGKGSIIGAGCILAAEVTVGEGCILHPRVVLEYQTRLGHRVIIQSGAVLGADGFGFAWTGQEYLKIPQIGCVVIGDDVEIGANTCIDRGAIGDTVIRRGVKLDNLIQIGHNVDMGEHSVMAGQAGVAGSVLIGKACQLGAQSGISGHLKLVDGCIVGGKAGVIGDLKEPGMVSGVPAVPHRQWLKSSALFDRLPKIWKKIKDLS